MDEYLSKIALVINGQQIDDFKSVEEKEYEVRKTIELARKTGFVKVRPHYGLSLEYVVPANSAEFDFSAVENGTIVLDFGNGRRRSYNGCCCLKVGTTKYDGVSETTRSIEFCASERMEE